MAHPAEQLFDLPFDGEMPMPDALAHAPAYSGPFADELAKLMRENPTMDSRRWERAKQDAVEFLADWGDQAAELGWTAEELFGLHPVAPLTRYLASEVNCRYGSAAEEDFWKPKPL